MSRRIAVVGGGPGGAFVARLLRMADPFAEVRLMEALPPLETFGFGVGLSISTQQNLGRSDPETFELIHRASRRGHGGRLYAGQGFARMSSRDQMAIARAELLQILYRQAEAVGVRIETGARHDAFDVDADVVIAADGMGSATRRGHAGEFGAREDVGRQRYIWCGAERALPDALFVSVTTEHGVFTTHAYPYSEDRSTFLVETDESTWLAAGFEDTGQGLAPGESDEVSLRYLERAFADHLQCRLLGNNSRWTQFRTIHCDRWHHDRVVLLGDAAHTAHYSIGSGTKLAMEDAIVLAHTLGQHADHRRALVEYQTQRQPKVARLQHLAERSHLWWEGFTERASMTPERLLASFLTRAGAVSLEDFVRQEPTLAREALRQYGEGSVPEGGIDDWVVSQPLLRDAPATSFAHRDAGRLDVDLLRVECRLPDPHGEEADAFIAGLRDRIIAQELVGVELDGPDSRAELLQRLDVAERVRRETSALVCTRGPRALLPDLAAGLVGLRTDLVAFSDPVPDPTAPPQRHPGHKETV